MERKEIISIMAIASGGQEKENEEHEGCAVLMTNGDDGNKSMEIGNRYAGKIFIDLLQKHAAE
jgi:alpha-amylase